MTKPAPDVLTRKVIPAGKVFIKSGEENSHAYVIQKGQVRAFVEEGGQKIEVDIHGPGTIIGEVCLVLDLPMPISYETMVDTTVATVTRQDFQKKLTRIDNTVRTIFTHLTHKLLTQDSVALDKARKHSVIDEQAFQIVRSLTAGLDDVRRRKYEEKILPHVNALIKAIKEVKKGERHDDQAKIIKEKIEEIQASEDDED
jgi:CRP-like cAMP-binding protein